MKSLLEDARKIQQKDREHFQKLLSEEKHWQQMVDTTKKSSEVSQRLIVEEKISQLQQDYDILLSRNNSLLTETDRLREELRMSNYRVGQLTLKLSESEKSFESVNQSNKDLTQQILTFRKDKDEWGRLEREMREELVVLRKVKDLDRLVLTSEVEELKRKLVRAEIERKELDGFRARLDREVMSLKKHVEALEEDKSRTEAAIRNTMSERRAIDKSLAAMEKENTELYRNCAQLQSQIAQLERDSGSNTIAKMLTDQKELEDRVAKLVAEKQQVEIDITIQD
uniref:Myosin_tail_1 domain-containing protein n=1 Tax=Angiostrongylus cantonensis TaxID=6313 RepID=A0A0K0DFE4_ANGCA